MQDFTVEQLEELIVLAEQKMIRMTRGTDEYRKEEELIGKLRDLRIEKLGSDKEA